MKPAVAATLNAMNQRFYETHADSFAQTRQAPWPGWSQLHVAPDAAVLDLGCGNGRYLRHLESQGYEGRFLGVDNSPSLLRFAEQNMPNHQWRQDTVEHFVRSTEARFDLVVAWGVLHHVPGFEMRLALIRQMLELLKPGGRLGVSLWQFRSHPRFLKRELDPVAFGLSAEELETGDALLDWQGNRTVPRYCHHFANEEIERIRTRLTERSTLLNLQDSADRFNVYLTLHT